MAKVSEVINEIAELIEGTVYPNYSGRFMFGKKCPGIVCSDPDYCEAEAHRRGFGHGKVDTLGLKYIVYWPDLSMDSEVTEVEDLEESEVDLKI
jgi:hypothetical protein